MAAPLSDIPFDAPAQPPGAQKPAVNPQVLNDLGIRYSTLFTRYETDRRLAELKWERNQRQYLGIYDPEVDTQIDKQRSRAYPKITRVKCVSMLSRLMNLLFPVDDKNWTISPTPVPNLDEADLNPILEALTPQDGSPPDDEAIEQAIREFARKRAARLELEILDQLEELGGDRNASWVTLCRKVLQSGIQYGCGVLRGPYVEQQTLRRWQMAAGKLVAVPYTAFRPRYEFVPIWSYYPDMGAKYFHQMDGQFRREVMSRHQLVKLKDRPDFMADQIDKYLAQNPQGNYRRRAYETEVRAMGVQMNVSASEINKFEAIIWEGYVPGRDLSECGVTVPEARMNDDVRAQLWMLGNVVIKAEIDPWTMLAPDDEIKQYHHFIFEEDESFLLGNGLPAIMRDSQMGICAATRMMFDNASVMRQFEVNTKLLRTDIDISQLNSDKIWYRDDDTPSTLQYPSIRSIELPTKLPELQAMVKMFQEFADQETFVNPATGGDMQRGPSEPFRTAAGASMLRGDAARPFKDVVRNFDRFTESVIQSLVVFNRVLNGGNEAIRGDFMVVARGATSLIAKEVHGMQLDNLANTLSDQEKPYLKGRNLLRARMRVRDLDVENLVYDDATCDKIDAQAQQAQQEQQAMQSEMIKAEIRKTLADALKNISQAGKNMANADATVANTILSALEKGINPDMITAQGANNEPSPTGGAGANPGSGSDNQALPLGPGAGGVQAATGAPVQAGNGQPAAMPA